MLVGMNEEYAGAVPWASCPDPRDSCCNEHVGFFVTLPCDPGLFIGRVFGRDNKTIRGQPNRMSTYQGHPTGRAQYILLDTLNVHHFNSVQQG
jgi:hypothetical protein